jgi:hypothetical protein
VPAANAGALRVSRSPGALWVTPTLSLKLCGWADPPGPSSAQPGAAQRPARASSRRPTPHHKPHPALPTRGRSGAVDWAQSRVLPVVLRCSHVAVRVPASPGQPTVLDAVDATR